MKVGAIVRTIPGNPSKSGIERSRIRVSIDTGIVDYGVEWLLDLILRPTNVAPYFTGNPQYCAENVRTYDFSITYEQLEGMVERELGAISLPALLSGRTEKLFKREHAYSVLSFPVEDKEQVYKTIESWRQLLKA